MLIFFLLLLIGSSWAVENVEITEPIDGATYDGDWLSVRAIVENDDELPDSVHHTLNGEPVILIPRLNTDWYTYMQDDLRQGYSESPAPTDNTILWSAPVTGTNHEFCSPVVYDGVVYFLADNDWGSSEDSVWALNAVSGNVLWARSAHGDTDDAVTVIGNLLYYSSDSLFCCNRFTGETLWSFAPEGGEGKISGTPVISDGNVYFDWSDDGSAQIDTVFALGAFSGNPIWKTALPEGNVQSCYTLYLGSLFVPTNDGPLYALDILDGTISWTNIDSQGGYWDSSPVVDDGVIYIGCYDGYVRAIDVNNGLTIWQTQIFTGAVEATPAFYDGVVYVGASMVFALSAADGDTLWSIDIGGIHGSPGMADGVLYWGDTSTGGIIHAVEMATGFEVWSYTVTGGSVMGFQSSPSIVDGVMYIAATDGNLYAFGTGLKYTYLDDLFAQVGANELIVTSFDESVAVAADTINFTVTGTGINLESYSILDMCTSPNPFSFNLSISYNLPEPALVELSVYDLSGRLVENLVRDLIAGGDNTAIWNPAPALPNGCYLIVLDACGERAVRRCVKLN